MLSQIMALLGHLLYPRQFEIVPGETENFLFAVPPLPAGEIRLKPLPPLLPRPRRRHHRA